MRHIKLNHVGYLIHSKWDSKGNIKLLSYAEMVWRGMTRDDGGGGGSSSTSRHILDGLVICVHTKNQNIILVPHTCAHVKNINFAAYFSIYCSSCTLFIAYLKKSATWLPQKGPASGWHVEVLRGLFELRHCTYRTHSRHMMRLPGDEYIELSL